jgi:hypothetical protein
MQQELSASRHTTSAGYNTAAPTRRKVLHRTQTFLSSICVNLALLGGLIQRVRSKILVVDRPGALTSSTTRPPSVVARGKPNAERIVEVVLLLRVTLHQCDCWLFVEQQSLLTARFNAPTHLAQGQIQDQGRAVIQSRFTLLLMKRGTSQIRCATGDVVAFSSSPHSPHLRVLAVARLGWRRTSPLAAKPCFCQFRKADETPHPAATGARIG